MEKKIAAAGTTKGLIGKNNFRIKKSLGQNFLIDSNIIEAIVRASGIDKEDVVLEIGPGMGALTQALSSAAGRVVAIELDRELIPILQESLRGAKNLRVVQGDALELNYDELLREEFAAGDFRPGFVVAANLPYYITTPLAMNLLEGGYSWRRMLLMVQREVAERMKAAPGSKDYGALSIGVQYRARASIVLSAPPEAFLPRPAVNSAVVLLERLPQPAVQIADEAFFFRLVKAAFGQRRKTLGNALASGLQAEKSLVLSALLRAEISASRRGETLSLQDFARLAAAFAEAE